MLAVGEGVLLAEAGAELGIGQGAANLSPISIQRSVAVPECDRLQSGQSAAAGAAEENWPLVAQQLAPAAGEDRRAADQTRALLLAFTSRRTSESEAFRRHAENDRGVAAAGRGANQGRKQTSARKPSSREVSAVRKSGTGKARTTAPHNGQNEPHYHA